MRIERSSLRALRSLSGRELGSLIRAWVYLLTADIALRFMALPRVERLLAGGRRRQALPAGRLAALVTAAARHHLLPMTCLPRALALQALLRRNGIPAELRIGVRREAGDLQAHAWIEAAGSPVGEPSPSYLPLVQIRSAR
ncbi:MAG: hypothetical protein QOH06_5310 [Acidobacteriota bacterium]|jgi:hypothetical protein|nr:hypothetical protein [Acidobacteriota bacterium]